MYYGNNFNGSTPACHFGEVELRRFLAENSDALGHAVVLLADRKGARLINAVRDGLGQPGRLTRRMRRLILDLRDLLFFEHVHEEFLDDEVCFMPLEPDDPAVPEICLLADGLEEALRKAGVIRAEPHRPA